MLNTSQKTPEITKESYSFLQQYVYQTSGIVLDDDKGYLLEARLAPIVRKANLKSINDLCLLIRAKQRADLTQEIIEAMTTNETLFFRDALPFKVLREALLPPLLEQRKSLRRLSFWSAASSSGQEAYSLMMMLFEMGLRDWKIDVLGTDLSERILDKARGGRYLQIEVNRGLPASHLVKYFTRQGTEWQIKDEIRQRVRFQSFDLRKPMQGLGPFDFVLCRNVLIYFDVATKKQILRGIEGTLQSGGYLLLGAAETTLELNNSFERRFIDGVSFYRKP